MLNPLTFLTASNFYSLFPTLSNPAGVTDRPPASASQQAERDLTPGDRDVTLSYASG